MNFAKHRWVPKVLVAIAFLAMIAQCWLVADTVLFHPASYVVWSDYFTSFHPAGWLFSHNQSSLIYPPADATSFAGAPFDQVTHRFLPQAPKQLVFMFMYAPVVAAIFSLLTPLAPNIACFVWQVLNCLALMISSFFIGSIVQRFGGTEQRNRFSLVLFLASFLFAPVFDVLWLGQVDLLFGLLPLCAGTFLLVRKQSLFAGLVLSLTFLKTQFVPAVFLFSLAALFRKDWKVLMGLLLGLVLLGGLSIIVAGPSVFFAWTASLHLSERLFSGGAIRNPSNLIASLPVYLTAVLPPAYAYIVYLVELICSAGCVVGIWFLARSRLDEVRWLVLSLCFSCVGLILYSPRLLTYDWVVFILPFSLILALRSKLPMRIVIATALLAMAGSCAVLLQLLLGFSSPTLFVGVATVLALFIGVSGLKYTFDEAAQEVT